jgi:hypothetical protein
MRQRLQLAMLLLGTIACPPSLCAQAERAISNPPVHPGAAEGQLTVTLTVATSVGVVMDEEGKPKIVIANAPDPADNVSSLHPLPQNESMETKTKK